MSPEDEPADRGGDAESLRHTVEQLTAENESLRRSAGGGRRHRGRKIGAWVLLVVSCILAVVSVLVVFVRNEVLDTDSYVATVAPLASDPAIQTAVATRVSHRLITETDLQQQVKSALPTKAGFLAGPITSGVQSATEQITLKVVQSDRFQTFWVNANRRAHEQVVNLLTGSTAGALQANNGQVTLDLGDVLTQAKQALDAHGITVFDKVPTSKAPSLVLIRSTQLTKLQRLVRFLDHLAVVLPIVTLLGFAGVVLLNENRRRGLVRASGGLALSMAVVLVVAAVVRNQYLSSLHPDQTKPAAAVFDAISALLLDSVRTLLIIAVLVAVGAVLAGNRWVRSWLSARHWPGWTVEGPVPAFVVAHRRGLQWATLGVGLVVIVAWSAPSTFVVVVIALVALAVVGLIGLYAGRVANAPPPVGDPGRPSSGPGDTADVTSAG